MYTELIPETIDITLTSQKIPFTVNSVTPSVSYGIYMK